MAKKKQAALFYPPAINKMTEIWAYSSQCGEDHADSYTAALYAAIEQQKNEAYHKLFPSAKIADLINEPVYFFLWRYKSRTPAHTVFYRILSRGRIAVIEIVGPGQQKNDCLQDALKQVHPLL